MALAVLVYDETGSALATSGLFVAAQFVPALFAPFLTARADRSEPRRALPQLYLGEALIFGGLALLAARFSLTLVYVLVLVDGILMLTARGVTRATVNALLSEGEALKQGNAMLNIGFALAGVAGAAIGGALIQSFGAGTVLAVDAATFAAIALLMTTLPRVVTADPEGDVDGLLARVRAGLSYGTGHPTLRFLIGGETLAIVFFALIVPIEVVYAKETLDTTDAGYGTLLAVWSAGTIGGSLLFAATRSRETRAVVLGSTALIGVAYLGMSASTALTAACAFSFIGGVGNGMQWVAVMTAVQTWTPDALQARVTGLLESAASIATGIGFLLGGIVVAVFSPPAAFAAAGAATLAIAGAGTFIRAPFDRESAAAGLPDGGDATHPSAISET